MKTIKKTVSAFLAVIMLCGCFVTAFAADGFTYTETDGEITVTGYSGGETALEIPGEIDGKPVTAIGSRAFKEKNITSVTVPASVKTIGTYAFLGCAKLASVEFAENSALETIEMSAFQSCSSLKSIVIPEGTQSVGRTVFAGTALEKITIPASVTAFYDTSIVTELSIWQGSDGSVSPREFIIYYGGTSAQWNALVENSASYANLGVFKNLLWSVDSKPFVNMYLRPGVAVTAPADPSKEHYTFKGWVKQGGSAPVENFGKMPDDDVRYNAKFEPVIFTAKFVADGEVIKTVGFTVDTSELNEPAVPEKEGYTGAWEPYELKPENITVNAVYTVNQYTAKFVYEGKTLEIRADYGSPLTAPEVDEKTGYDFVWSPEVPAAMPAKDVTFTGKYVQQVYEAKLFANGKQVGAVTYVYGQKSVQLPAVPEKEGYTGRWLPYSLPVGGTEIYAEYTVNTYTATFIVDGKQTVYNVEFGSPVKVPAVEAPQGYKLVWSPAVPATMPAKDITVNGSFVCVSKVSILKNTGKRSVDYGYSLVLYANASDLPDGAKLVWSIPGGKDTAGSEYNTGALKENRTVTLKLVGKDGKVIKDADGKEIKDTEEITVNGGFFKIIIWFFKNLFRADMTVYQK